MSQKISSIQAGVAGEYFVAAELSRRGYLASITLRNARKIDILATSADGSKAVTIQVKTNQGSSRRWILNRKAETSGAPNHFYVMVNLHGLAQPPSYHVVNSEDVAERTLRQHSNWLAGTKRNGRPRKDSDIRNFMDPDGEFLDAWQALGLD